MARTLGKVFDMNKWSAMQYGMAVVCGVVALLAAWATMRGLKAQETKSGWKGYDPYQPGNDE